ncbi:MAG: lipocalin-like domain-containing protein [Caulobacteraceae bacterium]|nr:lipocalin-like domain-containing protein [Caulobacteraceae bacterium]
MAGLGAILLATIATVAIAAGKGEVRPAPLTPAEAVAGQCAAWNTTDRIERDHLLHHVFAPDGVYSDPTPTHAAGPAALSDEIANFQRRNPGARFRCGAPQGHHGASRVSWLLLGTDGTVRTEGMDFYEFARDDRIHRVTGFFGPPPAFAARIVGAWRLVETRQRMVDGATRPDPDLGAHPAGYMIYDSSGRMCTVFSDMDRPVWGSDGPSPTDLRAMYDNTLVYCARYEEDDPRGVLVFHLELGNSPNTAGTTRERRFALTGDELTLYPTPLPAGVAEWSIHLKRVPGH